MSLKFKEYKDAGIRFLVENRKRPEVSELSCGVQYQVIVKGSGPKPAFKDKVKVHYKGYLTDNKEFDNSYKRKKPEVFGLYEVIKGWSEALKEMPVGSKWIIYIPYELGYGTRAEGKIKPYSTLIFEVELLAIV